MTDKPEFVKKRTDMSTIPTKQYIDQTIAPILLEAIKAVANERPIDPVQYLADFLIKHKNANGEQQREPEPEAANGTEPTA